MGWPAKYNFPAGEDHPRAKLTNEELRDLRRRALLEPQARLAREYGLSRAAVCQLVHHQKRPDSRHVRLTSLPDLRLERFLARVEKTVGCWHWRGSRQEGRARYWFQGQWRYARDVAYLLLVGEVPAGRVVLQACGNVFCVRPDHLVLDLPWCRHRRGPSHPRWRGGCTR